jgi:phosphomannomutase/phosphoglucomutase
MDAEKMYVNFLGKLFSGVGKGKKIVVDGGNGVAGPCYVQVLKNIGCQVIELYTEPDGTFPNHAADPSKHATLKELQDLVKKEKADCGFAFDGDGDRMGLVDEKGAIVTADQTLLLLAQDHLSRQSGAPVIFTVSNSSLLETEVKKWGGKPVMCKVGHSFVEHAMREHTSLLGGEQSGHFFCGEDYFGFDDALVATLRILSLLKGGAKISELTSKFPVVYQAQERRPHCPDDKKADVVRRATEFFAKKYPVVTLDGARIDFGDGAWAGIRFSNTSPCLSICIEARSAEKLMAVETQVLEHLRTYEEVKL